jgi:stearoyl-CoA desaturase (Delta-9 desaturase)
LSFPTVGRNFFEPNSKQGFSARRRILAWTGTMIGVTVPLLGVVAAAIMLWEWGFGWTDLILLLGMYVVTMIGITVGFHRLFSHRSFQATRPVQFVLGVLGSMAFQGPLIDWVGRHRVHHRFSDTDGDMHSPHGHGGGFWRSALGFWHAHIGWAFAPMQPEMERYAGDLVRSPMLRTVSALFPIWALVGLLIPALFGFAIGGWRGALSGFVWGGLIRVFLCHHATWSVNSVCHLWGSRPYANGDESRNNGMIGLLALGEGWHNNHHAFPSSARHGLRWWQIDVSYWVICGLVACGLAWRVRLPTSAELATRSR